MPINETRMRKIREGREKVRRYMVLITGWTVGLAIVRGLAR